MAKIAEIAKHQIFSKYSTKQVVLKVHTLEQTMKNKIGAALERGEVRDCYDIEFLLRQGIPLMTSGNKLAELKKLIGKFKEKDFKVTLGATLEPGIRKYYIENRFDYLLKKIPHFTK